MQNKAHWQALYDAMRTALDNGGHNGVPIYHATSIDTQTGEGEVAPFIVYRQDVERSLGTMGGGALKTLSSGWVITSYAFDLEDGLEYLSLIETALADSTLVTTDGFTTMAFEVIGVQTIYEDEYKVYGTHLRVLWHRSS